MAGSDTEPFSVVLDVDPPVVNIAAPTAGAFLRAENVPVSFDVSDASAVSVTCRLYKNQSTVVVRTNCSSGDVLGTAFTSTATRITVTAVDAGNRSTTASVTFTTDSIAPTLSLNPIVGIGGYTSPTANFQIDYYAYDSSGPPTVVCSWDGNQLASCPDPVSIAAATNGSHTLSMTATDRVGNSSTASRSYVVDTSRPVVNISSPTGGWEGRSDGSGQYLDFVFSYGSSAIVASVICKLDNSSMGSCSSGMNRLVSNGNHVFSVTVTDVNGVSTTVSSSFSVFTINVGQCPPGYVCLPTDPNAPQ
ncbi:MAG: hypothetical protein JHC87_02910 [Thermoleophilaceae bacterium]|nr:hypothetical protein [Thermoleophilaceae bacterium]